MNSERSHYRIQPEDVLREDEYETLQRAQQGELPCPGCETTLSGHFYFNVVDGRQLKGVQLSCSGCGFREM